MSRFEKFDVIDQSILIVSLTITRLLLPKSRYNRKVSSHINRRIELFLSELGTSEK